MKKIFENLFKILFIFSRNLLPYTHKAQQITNLILTLDIHFPEHRATRKCEQINPSKIKGADLKMFKIFLGKIRDEVQFSQIYCPANCDLQSA